ncbi:MAG TPA: MDR family MFS transporter [Longimicrobiales bacterium]
MRAGRERKLVTAGLVLGMAMSALEATAVATAMPRAIADLGGVSRYSWVFSAYLLTSTTTVPMFGKLADLYGRQRIYQLSVLLFLLGTGLSGAAQSMNQLIIFRALQGVGAGGVGVVSVTIIGDIYALQERGRIQGVFSGVWGISSLVGPAAGGLITDLLSWRWVFYVNLPVGLLSALVLRLYFSEEQPRREHSLDIAGTLLLTVSVTLLLLAVLEGSEAWGLSSPITLAGIAASLVGLGLFLWQETRASEPMLPLDLFRNKVIAYASLGSTALGTLLLVATAYVPMFAQGVLGSSATEAGMSLATMSIGWPIASTIAGRLLLRVPYRRLVIFGGITSTMGTALIAMVGSGVGIVGLSLIMGLTGFGLGFMATPYLVAVQNAVPWSRRGVATSAIQFFRTIGGAVAVALFGALLNQALAPVLGPGLNANAALEPAQRARLAPGQLRALVGALDTGLHRIFIGFLVIALAGLVASWFFPRGAAQALAHAETPGADGTPGAGGHIVAGH